jgi:hypothetical protein
LGINLLTEDIKLSIKKNNNMVPEPQAYQPKQLSLWQDFLCNTTAEKKELSNTIELWDAIPKYPISPRKQDAIRKDGFLPIATRIFEFRGQSLEVKIRPARLIVDGKEIEFYPSGREELVEDALRKIACVRGNGYLDADRSGVSFTLYELRKELKQRGHTLSYYQVVESLEILSGSNVEVGPVNQKSLYKTAPLTSLLAVTKSDLKKDPKSRWHVDFSSLVTNGIKNVNYRQYNYGLNMGLKTQLCRYLHKKLAHNYIQASMLNPYTISFTSISRDSGLLECVKFHDNRRKLEDAFDELVSSEVLMSWKIDKVHEGKGNSIADITYCLIPSFDFTAEQKRSNKRANGVADNQDNERKRGRTRLSVI